MSHHQHVAVGIGEPEFAARCVKGRRDRAGFEPARGERRVRRGDILRGCYRGVGLDESLGGSVSFL